MGARKLTPELVALHERLRSEGVPLDVACKIAGHSVRVYYAWKDKADAGENGIYADFRERLVPLSRTRGALNLLPESKWRNVAYFRRWAKTLVRDDGKPFRTEKWQEPPIADLLSGRFQMVWMIVPEGNGKTTLAAAVGLFLLEHQATPEIPIGSATVTQAETLFRQIEGFIVRSGKMSDFHIAPGVRRIDCRKTHGHLRIYPHNERSGDGVIPSAWMLDEGHLHPDLRLYRLWKGKYNKRKGIGLGISTAGEPNSEFEDLRGSMLKGADRLEADGPYVRAITGATVLHDWAVRNRDEADDIRVVAKANPLRSVTIKWLRAKKAEPEMTHEHWLRRTCNIATRVEGQAYTGDVWDALALPEDVSASSEAWKIGFLDLGWEIDCSALGILSWEANELRIVTGIKVIKPPVDEADIVEALVYRQREFGPVGWVYDPHAGAQQMVQLLEKGEHPRQEGVKFTFIEHSQDNAPMALAASRLDEAIRLGWLRHDGDPELRKHVLNLVRRPLGGEKWKLDRPPTAKGERRKYFPIDAATGLLIGHSVAVSEQTTKPELIAALGKPR